jgi:methyl-accepting chemotaxis protein
MPFKSRRTTRFGGNTRISTKLVLLVFVLTIPIAVLLYLEFRTRQHEISFAQSETDGLNYVADVIPLLRDVQQHRSLAQEVLSGDRTSRDALGQSTTAVNADLAKLAERDRKVGGRFGTATFVSAINEQWPRLRDAGESDSLDDNFAAHTRVIEGGILPLLDRVGTRSRLFLDPNMDSRAVISALMESLPRVTEGLSEASGVGVSVLLRRSGQQATDGEKLFVNNQMVLASAAAETMIRDLEKAMAANPRFERALRPLLQKNGISRENFATRVNTDIVNSRSLASTASQTFFLLGGSAINSSNQLVGAAQTVLNDDFQSRVDGARMAMYWSGGAAFGGLLVATVLVMLLGRSITRPVKRLVDVADRMSLGELDVEIDVTGTNEIGQLAESLRRMQASLRSAIERLRMRRAA